MELNVLLADLYDKQVRAQSVVRKIGLNPKSINFGDPPIDFWANILEEARRRDKIRDIFDLASKEFPNQCDRLLEGANEYLRLTGSDVLIPEDICVEPPPPPNGPKVWLVLLGLGVILILILASLNPPPPDVPPPRQLPEMIRIPAGDFNMGTSKEEVRKLVAVYPSWEAWMFEKEKADKVNVAEFFIGKFEVTNEQYKEFLKEHPDYGDIEALGVADHPVTNVTWNQALAYCEWLSKITKNRYSLPTETQWEKAARGTDGRWFPWGYDRPSDEFAIFSPAMIGPINSKPKDSSFYGVKSMAGNVAEWCYNSQNDEGQIKAVRGGSWKESPFYLRCAARDIGHGRGESMGDLGFRVAMDPPDAAR